MISVIVPVYNCEKYIEDGIKSLIGQTIFDDLEIIYVNDGSTDASSDIVKKYVCQYPNMKIIEQSNQGVSAARNRGITEASGEYITFFDADDIAQNTLYEELLRLLRDNQADMSCVNYSMRFDDGVIKVHKPMERTVLCGDEILQSFLSSNVLCNNTFDKLFNLSIVGDIRFPEGYAIGEDMFFVFQYLLKCNKVAVDNSQNLYIYNIRSGSAMKSDFNKKYFDPVILAKKMMEMISGDCTHWPYAEANWIHECCKTMALYYRSGSSQFRQEIEDCRQLISSYPLSRAIRYLSKKHLVAWILMRYSPRLYVLIYNMLRIG